MKTSCRLILYTTAAISRSAATWEKGEEDPEKKKKRKKKIASSHPPRRVDTWQYGGNGIMEPVRNSGGSIEAAPRNQFRRPLVPHHAHTAVRTSSIGQSHFPPFVYLRLILATHCCRAPPPLVGRVRALFCSNTFHPGNVFLLTQLMARLPWQLSPTIHNHLPVRDKPLT